MTSQQTTSSLDSYAVMGNPIAHSQSPLIHTAFAQQTGQAIQYQAILVGTAEGEFTQAVQDFQAQGGKGLNITVPFKQLAWELCHLRSELAERAGAVNTISFDSQGQRLGDNTDGIGLIRDLIQNQGGQINGQRVLILGAGGAVRGILGPILKEAPAHCVIANRTLTKAKILAQLFITPGQNITACPYDALPGQRFDLIINGTSASLQGQLPPLPDELLATDGWCYDLMYASTPTPFLQWALTQTVAHVTDGLGMLVEQAAEAFYLWRGIRPNTLPVIQQLRQQLTNHQIPPAKPPTEIGGPLGLEPTRYGDWERKGRCIDF